MPLLTNVQMSVASAPGTGTVTLGSATTGAQSFAAAGATDATLYSYRIEEGANWEIGVGTYTASGTTITRTIILSSSNAGAAVSFGAGAIISHVALPRDIPAPFRNRIINGNFAINQRAAASASTSYAAGTYILDRWKAGSGGVTLSWSAATNGDVTVTITAGTLLQIIEGPFYLADGGVYCLQWTGTAVARFTVGGNSTPYGISPYLAALTGGVNLTVEFSIPSGSSSATLGLVQIAPGLTVTDFERRDDEVRRCWRYYYAPGSPSVLTGYCGGAGFQYLTWLTLPAQMRVQPTCSAVYSAGTNVSNTNTSVAGTVITYSLTGAAAGYIQATVSNIIINAEL